MPVLRLLILLSCFISCCAWAKPTIHLATTAWEPYVRDDAYKGYAYEIVTSAFTQAGYDVQVTFMPWQQAVAAVRNGDIDGIFPEYYAPEDTADIAYTVPFSGGPIAMFKRVDKPLHTSVTKPGHYHSTLFAELKDQRFGVVAGYHNVPALDDNPKLKKVVVGSDLDNIHQLYEGKVDIIVIDKFTAEHLLQNRVSKAVNESIVFMPPILGYKKLYVGVSKRRHDHKQILKHFQRGLQQIHRNGEFAKIIDRDAYFTGKLIA